MPHMSKLADEWTIIRSMHTEAINHDPAITFMQTGSQLAGRPSIGSWVGYGLGSENRDLPAYVVLTSFGSGRPDDQPLYDRLWSAGFLPSKHQGVKFRNKGDRVLYLSNPPGMDTETRRETLDELTALNKSRFDAVGDPEIQARIAQYEMAFKMQARERRFEFVKNLVRRSAGKLDAALAARKIEQLLNHIQHSVHRLVHEPAEVDDRRLMKPAGEQLTA